MAEDLSEIKKKGHELIDILIDLNDTLSKKNSRKMNILKTKIYNRAEEKSKRNAHFSKMVTYKECEKAIKNLEEMVARKKKTIELRKHYEYADRNKVKRALLVIKWKRKIVNFFKRMIY